MELAFDGTLLCCYACGVVAAVSGPQGTDPLGHRLEWPEVPCPAGCGGRLEPEALN